MAGATHLPQVASTTRSVGRPPGGDARQTRARLLRSARSAFAQRGYEGTAIREVAAAAGVTLPTLYHHFGSKAGLFAEAYRDADRQLLEALEAAIATHDGFRERLVAMVEAVRVLQRHDPTVAGVLAAGQIETARTPELAAARGPGGAAVPTLLARMVDDARRRGELPPDTDPAGVIGLLSAMAVGVALTAGVLEPGPADEIFDAWHHAVAGELFAPAAGASGGPGAPGDGTMAP